MRSQFCYISSTNTIRITLVAGLVFGLLFFIPQTAYPSQGMSALSANAGKTPALSSQFATAAEFLQQGDLDRARSEVTAQLKSNPASVEGYNLLGIICGKQKDYPRALEALQHALKLDPRSSQTRINLANIYVATGHPDLAKKQFMEVLRASPTNRDANYNLGLLLLASGSPAESIVRFQRVRPANTETRLNLVRAYLRAGKIAEGLREASNVSATKTSSTASTVELHVTVGLLLASEKQYKAAAVQFEAANALQPETFEILYNLGNAYFLNGQYSEAELVVNRALKTNSESVDGLYLLGEIYSRQQRPLDALDALVRAHKLAPENTDVIFLLARVSMSQNYFEDAIPLLEAGVKIAPRSAQLHAALGESYFMAGKTERAIEQFQTLIVIDPSAGSYSFLGLSYRHLGRFEEARKYFLEGLKLDPHNASCLFNLGFIEERQGNSARAEELFQKALHSKPDYSEALFELANLRTKDKKLTEAETLLKQYVRVSRNPASGYYKLAMVERSLHQIEAAQRDLNVFQTLSKDANTGPYPFENLFEYVDSRSMLPGQARTAMDLKQLGEEIEKHPGQPQDLYLLAETYLKLGNVDDARKTAAQLDQISADDFRTQNGIGVLFARYRLFDDAIQHFQAAARANPESDDVKFNIANAYFHKRDYAGALDAARSISATGLQGDATLALLGDIYAHLGDTAKATQIFSDAIDRNPDNDQYYLSLTLIELREGKVVDAEHTLQKGLARIPNSGKLIWGLGLVSVLQGKTMQAGTQLERAVELLPEWVGSYSTLGVFYFQTGQIDKAREVLNRFKGSNAGGLDVGRIEETLSKAPAVSASGGKPLPMQARQQLLQIALTIADRTL
jgi:tetratricopeptide (TPR) repeat protein